MMRFRRYRVFLTLAVFLLLGTYYLFDIRGWGGRSSVALRNTKTPAKPDSVGSEKSTSKKPEQDSDLRKSPSNNQRVSHVEQVPMPGNEEKSDKGKGRGKGKGDSPEFPHKKINEGPDIDEKLPKGKHDKHVVTSTIEPVHFTKLPEQFPVPKESIIPLPKGKPKAIPRIQHDFARETTPERKDRRKKLKKLKSVFLKHWAGYKEHAWDHDELKPLSGGYQDPFAGWRATLVDTLDMLWIMNLKDEFEEAVEEVGSIDFLTTHRDSLPLFEVVIRYMGGLIAAYDISEAKYPVLLEKAKELAEVLMPAFDTPNRMPTTNYQWRPEALKRAKIAAGTSILAELGSLNMEFIRLAQITKDNKYYDAVARITDEFEAFQNETRVPGLWPQNVDATGGCTLGDLEKERYEEATGTKIQNTGTSNEKDSGRKIKDMVKDSPGKPTKPDVEDIISEKDKSSFGKVGSDAKSRNSPAKGKLVGDKDEGSQGKPKKAGSGSEKLKKSFDKRAPPKYIEEFEGHPRKSSSTDDTKDIPKKPVPKDDDDDDDNDQTNTRASAKSTKSKSQDEERDDEEEEDDDVVGSEKSKAKVKLSHDSKSGSEKQQKGKSSFGDDEHPELERPSTNKGPKADSSDKIGHKSKSSFADDTDEVDGKRKKPADGKKATDQGYHEETKSKDKSSFGDDVDAERKRPSSKEKPLIDSEDNHKPRKGKSSTSDDDDDDEDEEEEFSHKAKPKIRSNKPMHKCVTRGLRSSYGGRGIDKFTLGGMTDSVYEYLPKSYLLLGGLEDQYRRMHETAMSATKDYLLFRAMTNETKRHVYFTGDFNSLGEVNNETGLIDGTFVPHTGHLTCFQGAFIALAARAFRNEKDVDLARKLTDGCVWAYEQTATGIMPELFDMVPCVNLTGPCKFNKTAWWNGMDPHAQDRVDQNVKLIADAEADGTLPTGSAKKLKGGFDNLIRRFHEPSKAANNKIRDSAASDKEMSLPPSKASEPRWADGAAVSDGRALERRRPPNTAQPQTPEEAQSSLLSAPTTLPDYFKKYTEVNGLAPGMTKITAREYILRPEAIESVFYMYRITGDPVWRDKGWHMFESINNATATEYGNSAIDDVTQAHPPTLRDKAESFWTAETLKYFWLLFSEPNVVSLDDWVFNTEAHPFRRPDLDVKRDREAEQARRRKGMGGNMVWDLD